MPLGLKKKLQKQISLGNNDLTLLKELNDLTKIKTEVQNTW